MTKIKLFAGAALALPLVLIAGQAGAQSINYSALQDVFGEPVTTSATGSPQRASEAPVAMDIITAEDIKRSGATDIPTILSRVAGVDVETWSAGGQSDVDVRGYDTPYSPRLLVLVNGRQVYLDDYGYTDWDAIPVQLSEIKQIEVVKGPNSALFGFNAVGGVVNIITDNPKYDNTNSGSVSAGANGLEAGSLVSTFHLGDRVQVRISGGGLRENQWKNNGVMAASIVTPASKVSGNLDTVVQLAPKAELRLEGSWSHDILDQMFPVYSYALNDTLTNSAKATLNFDTQFGLITADAYQNDLAAKSKSATLGPAYYKNSIKVAQLQDLFKIGSANTFRISLEYRHNANNVNPLPGGYLSYNVYAASGMWNWAINNKLALTAAVRYDTLDLSRTGTFPAHFALANNALYNRTVSEPTANIGLTYKATDVDSFRASFARGVQVPNLIELGAFQAALHTPVGTVAITGEPYVDPTTVTSYEVGYDRDLPQFGAKVGIDVYTEKTDDIQGLPVLGHFNALPSAGNPIYPTEYFVTSSSDSQETGVEFTAKGKIRGGYHWAANWTYTDIKDTPKPGYSLVPSRVNYSQLTPSNRGNFNGGWAGDKLSIDTYVRYVSRYINPLTPTPLGDYWTLALHGGYAITPKINFGVTAENALENRQLQSTPLEASRRIFATLSTTW